MRGLKEKLAKQIPVLRKQARELIKKHGDEVISQVTVSQLFGGMRGVKGLVCDTSVVDADQGLAIRGIPIGKLACRLPEEIFYLLCTGELPDAEVAGLAPVGTSAARTRVALRLARLGNDARRFSSHDPVEHGHPGDGARVGVPPPLRRGHVQGRLLGSHAGRLPAIAGQAPCSGCGNLSLVYTPRSASAVRPEARLGG